MTKRKLLFIFGTRPEAIKMAPLIKKAAASPYFSPIVCVTAQHREMLDQVLDFFGIVPDYDLDLMEPNQDLLNLTSKGVSSLSKIVGDVKPDLIVVQGDTTTTFIGALVGFHKKIGVVHIEAGLRSGNNHSPFPEEINRKLTGQLAAYHFAPTMLSTDSLYKENIKEHVYTVGNTVIDALFLGLDIIKAGNEQVYNEYFKFLDVDKKIILITGHRRESFGAKLENVCHAIRILATKYPDVQFVYPVHPNPHVRESVTKELAGTGNVFLIEPLDYSHMLWLMEKSYIIITDSGGIQEEAPSLGKPVLVTREVTERMEGVEAGTAKLVGSNTNLIVHEVETLLTNKKVYNTMSEAHNPYGDGRAAEYILGVLEGER